MESHLPTVAERIDYEACRTERLRALVEFLNRPVSAPKDHDGRPDVDVEAAYNLAVVDALHAVRQIAVSSAWD